MRNLILHNILASQYYIRRSSQYYQYCQKHEINRLETNSNELEAWINSLNDEDLLALNNEIQRMEPLD